MKRTAAVLMLLFLLTACSPAPEASPPPTAAPTPSPTPEPTPTELASSPWLEDYNYFWDVIEENYPFYHAVKRITGNDLAEVRERYLAEAQAAQSAQDLYKVLEECSTEMGYTGHLTLYDGPQYARVMGLYRGFDDPKIRYLYELMDNPTSRAFYGYDGPENNGTSAGAASASGNLLFQYFPNSRAACVEILLMDMSRFDEDMADLTAFYARLESEGYEHCIVDIRRNGGGSTSYGPMAVAAPNLTEPVVSRHYALVRGGQEVLDYMAAIKDSWPLHPIEELPVDELPALHPDDLALSTHFFYIDVNSYAERKASPAFSGRFWLLTSPRVYSASEYFAVFCKDTGFATLVGETTGGDGIGLNPLVCVLPNSGIVYQFSPENGLNLDGSCNEEYGTTPDIVIEAGQDALTVCLEAISAEK